MDSIEKLPCPSCLLNLADCKCEKRPIHCYKKPKFPKIDLKTNAPLKHPHRHDGKVD